MGKGISKTAMWILMGLLILGLAGFGAVNLSGNIRSIGTVGDKSVSVDQYARQLAREIRSIEQQTGQQLPMTRVQAIGLDRAVLQRLVRARALDHETSQIGLSIGDVALREEILEISSFQALDGSFDREGYAMALRQSGMTEAEFEVSLREEASRTLLQSAILGGVTMPPAYAETLVNFVGEQRSFTWTTLDAEALDAPLDAPSTEELRAFYDENNALFMLPATKRITYVLLTPDDLLATIEIPEDQLRAEYDARIDQFNQPERRLVERLVFADQESADQAAANLEVQGTTFEALVEERGLALADVDMGDVGRLELDAAGETVFGAETGEVVGPLPSDLGPAIFRVNGVLPAQNTTFEEARETLRQELASDAAVRAVEARAQEFDDQLAGGVTLEQIAEETEMQLGTIDWTAETSDGIAAYAGFRERAATLKADDFPQIGQLADGSIFAARLEESLDERLASFEEVSEDVASALQARRTVEALTAKATALVPALGGEGAFEAAGLDAIIETDQTRRAFISGVPADFMTQVFGMAEGDVTVLPHDETVVIVRLDAIAPASASDESNALLARLEADMSSALAQDLFNIYNNEILREAVPEIDQRAVQAVHVNFP